MKVLKVRPCGPHEMNKTFRKAEAMGLYSPLDGMKFRALFARKPTPRRELKRK